MIEINQYNSSTNVLFPLTKELPYFPVKLRLLINFNEKFVMDNKYLVGSIVTFKTHPLLYDLYIKGDGKLVPPFMVVKEVFFESKKKQLVDEISGETIAERIKYNCIFFDDNKTEFKEVMIYESLLQSFKNIFIAKMEGDPEAEKNDYDSLISEAKKYNTPKYIYGNIIYFRTKKFEIFKKRISKKLVTETIKEERVTDEKETKQYVVNYSTPDFVICGFKKNETESLFYPNGDNKKLISSELFKVKWFNSSQLKFSEQYLPKECFFDKQPFETKIKHNLSPIPKPPKQN